jgi:hypothetical protein
MPKTAEPSGFHQDNGIGLIFARMDLQFAFIVRELKARV